MIKVYNTLEDIEMDLKRLDLERQIAIEEMKAVKGELQESLQPAQWIQTGLKLAGKLGAMLMLKRLFK